MPLLTLLGQVSVSKTIGGTTQLGALSSTGGLNVFSTITVGGTDQLGALSSTGGLQVNSTLTIGGTDQLGLITSIGGIQVGEVATTEENTGGFWFRYEQEMYRRADERKKAERLKKEAEKKKKQIAKELEEAELRLIEELEAEERKVEAEQARIVELSMLTKLVSEEKSYIEKNFNDNVIIAANRAINQGNYSAMEALERQLIMAREEELFLIQAAEILLNQ